MLSKFCQNPCSCFGYILSYNHPNEVIPIGKKILDLRLPNTILKMSSGSSQVSFVLGIVIVFWS